MCLTLPYAGLGRLVSSTRGEERTFAACRQLHHSWGLLLGCIFVYFVGDMIMSNARSPKDTILLLLSLSGHNQYVIILPLFRGFG